MGVAFLILGLTMAAAESPGVVVLPARVPSDLAAASKADLERTLSEAVAAAGFLRLPAPATWTGDCADADCARRLRAATGCDWVLTATLVDGAGLLTARLTLIDAVGTRPTLTQLNRVPREIGIPGLDLASLTAVLLQATTDSRFRPTAAVVPAPDAQPTEPEAHPAPVVPLAAIEPVTPPTAVATDDEQLIRPAARLPTTVTPDGEEPSRRPEKPPSALRGEALRCGLCGGGSADVFLSLEDWERYDKYRQRTSAPLPVAAWVEHQNEESMALNVAWISPPIILLLGLFTSNSILTAFGLVLLPVAIVTAIIDAVDVGEVRTCGPNPVADRRDP